MPWPEEPLRPDVIFHASCVAVAGRAVLIRGASGSGKSALALELMSRGAALISDDRTCLTRVAGGVIASAPETLLGLIEARGVGILRAQPGPPSPIMLCVDLDRIERDRLPPPRTETVLGLSLPLLHKVDSGHFPAAILQYLTKGLWSQP